MAIEVRAFTMKGQFAKNAQTVIPPIPISGQQYRNTATTKSQIEAGQSYDNVGPSGLWNETMFEATGIARLAEQFGFVPWSPYTDYIGNASWCLGQDGIPYRAVLDSGPGDDLAPGVGAKPPPDSSFWETMADYISRIWSGGGGGGGTSGIVYPTAFFDFLEQSPPVGWMVRNGGLISSADSVVPDLWEALQQPGNAWKLLSESAWQSQSQSSPWNGVGGVPRFVLDVGAKTIRLPDTRGMFRVDSGFNGQVPGGAYKDTIRNITGSLDLDHGVAVSGSFYMGDVVPGRPGTVNDNYPPYRVDFDASRVVPTGPVNQPKAFGMLGCVYVGVVS